MTLSTRCAQRSGGVVSSFDEERLDALLGFLGTARFKRLLALLMAECREGPAQWRAMHARGDSAALRAEARALSVAAANLGAVALRDAASELERLGNQAGAAPLIDALERAARETLAAARGLLRQPDPQSAPARLH
jgi:HPt (histidine-containing phosphotransfer) domain-containing protein